MKDRVYAIFEFVGEYSLYGLLFFLPISNALVEVFVGLIIFSFIVRKIVKPDFRFLKFKLNIFILFFLIFSSFSLFNSGVYLNISLRALLGKWTQYLGIFIIIQDGIYCRKVVKRAMFVFLASASLVVLSGLTQYFYGIEFLRQRSICAVDQSTKAMTSSFEHYNSFGTYLGVVLPLAIVLLLASGSFGLKAASLLFFSFFSTIALILTYSRGSWLALIVSLIFVLIFSRRNFIRLIPIFLILIVVFLFPTFYERLIFIFRHGGDSGRFGYWMATLKMISEHPFFGVGIGTYMANYSRFVPDLSPAYAHNCYLQIWAETGIFSLVTFMFFVISLIWFGVRNFLVSKDFLLLGLLSGALGLLIHSFFDTNLYSLRLAILFWAWAGLIASRVNEANNI